MVKSIKQIEAELFERLSQKEKTKVINYIIEKKI